MRQLIVLMLLSQCHLVSADEKANQWKEFYQSIAKKYVIKIDSAPPELLKLSNYPALVWSNPARAGDTNGAFWVWTRDGRPEAVGTIFSYIGGDTFRVVAHEFHSLSKSALSAQLNGQEVWSPAKGGVEWKSLPGMGKPQATRPQRLLQMRRIARQFDVTAQNEVEQAEGEQPMRLLPQPLYRYETSEGDIDGALFTFVLGTDPECLLLIESGPENKTWKVAIARFTHLSFRVEHKGETLFEHIRGTQPEADSNFRYICFRNGSAPLEPPSVAEE